MDHYYRIGNHDIHMLQLSVSMGIVIMASCIVVKILSNSLRKDFKSMELAAISRKAKKAARAKASHGAA